MERIDKILNHDLFKYYVSENEKEEKNRLFCHHDMGHFLDVARIARILNLEEKAGLDVEIIYAAALLHDIGRHLQYREKIPHEEASVMLAPRILQECGYKEEEQEEILFAIAAHRDREKASKRTLAEILYRADKLSRPCFCCKQESNCNWKQEKKNRTLRY